MPNIDTNLSEIPRKSLPLFYVLDTSARMPDSLNQAMEETVEALKQVAEDCCDAILELACLAHNIPDCKWLTPLGPESLEDDIILEPLYMRGPSELGPALEELNSKLSRKEFLNSLYGCLIPVIIFVSASYPEDDYAPALKKLSGNRWFQNAHKIGFAFGEDADPVTLASLVGDPRNVIHTNDPELFSDLLRSVSVSAIRRLPLGLPWCSFADWLYDICDEITNGRASHVIAKLDPKDYDPEPPISTQYPPDWSWDSEDGW